MTGEQSQAIIIRALRVPAQPGMSPLKPLTEITGMGEKVGIMHEAFEFMQDCA